MPKPHLREAAVVLARLANVHAVVLQVVAQHNFANAVVLNVALGDGLLEVAIEAQYLLCVHACG